MTTEPQPDILQVAVGEREQRRRVWRMISFVVGALMLGGAAWAVILHHDVLDDAIRNVRGASVLQIGLLLLLPLGNWALTSGVLLTLTRRYGRVGAAEMHALVGSAWLMNYLPMKPGLFGRVAYHKLVNNIRVRDSVKVLMQAIVCGVIAIGTFALLAALQRLIGGAGGSVSLRAVLIGIVPGVIVYGILVSRPQPQHGPAERAGSQGFMFAAILRLSDLALWTLRFWVAFEVLGVQVGFGQVLAIAAATQAGGLLPIQFGLAEWAAGATMAAWAWASPRTELPPDYSALVAVGLSAGLLNRAAEIITAMCVGLPSILWVRRSVKASGLAG